jgi:hypothetical protein
MHSHMNVKIQQYYNINQNFTAVNWLVKLL